MAEGDLLGRTEFTVAELMGARSWTVTRKLTAQVLNKDYGTVTIMGMKLEVRYLICGFLFHVLFRNGSCAMMLQKISWSHQIEFVAFILVMDAAALHGSTHDLRRESPFQFAGVGTARRPPGVQAHWHRAGGKGSQRVSNQ
jgi:hypothetical protein